MASDASVSDAGADVDPPDAGPTYPGSGQPELVEHAETLAFDRDRVLLRLEVRNSQVPIERKPEWIKTRLKTGPCSMSACFSQARRAAIARCGRAL